MSGILRLDQSNQLWHNGISMREAWINGSRVWSNDPLARYYGTGPGQVPMDLRFGDTSRMSIINGKVVSVQNAGGAGAFFDASAHETSAPTFDNVAKAVRFTSPQAMTLANPANMAGVHALMALRLPLPSAAANTNLIMSANNKVGLQLFIQTAGPRIRFLAPGFTHYPGSAPASLYGQWIIAEYRYAAGAGTLIINGSVHGTQAGTVADTFVNTIRGPYSTNGTGALGYVESVVCDPAYSAISPEPAVLAIRNRLAQEYGITLA